MQIIRTINEADRLYNMFLDGMIPFLIFKEAMINVGAYRVTHKGFTIDGIRWSYPNVS